MRMGVDLDNGHRCNAGATVVCAWVIQTRGKLHERQVFKHAVAEKVKAFRKSSDMSDMHNVSTSGAMAAFLRSRLEHERDS